MHGGAKQEFWKSSGYHLVERDGNGWMKVGADYLRAYLTRPEIHPVEESCAAEVALFEELMADPFRAVTASELEAMGDQDVAVNYSIVLGFRDHLAAHGTIEAAYAALFREGEITLPPIFIDQMVHLIMRNVLDGEADPFRLRAAEIFFRDQTVTIQPEKVMLADHEIVAMRAAEGAAEQLLPVLSEAAKEIEIDILDEDNADIYWARSDNFDTAVDFSFTKPAMDAFARILDAWVAHFLGLHTRTTAMPSIRDEKWSWHVGLDAQSTEILNALYDGKSLNDETLARIVALFRMEFLDPGALIDSQAGKPVYLGLAMDGDSRIRMKPQNLIVNLPLKQE